MPLSPHVSMVDCLSSAGPGFVQVRLRQSAVNGLGREPTCQHLVFADGCPGSAHRAACLLDGRGGDEGSAEVSTGYLFSPLKKVNLHKAQLCMNFSKFKVYSSYRRDKYVSTQ